MACQAVSPPKLVTCCTMSSSFDADIFASCLSALCALISAMGQFNKTIWHSNVASWQFLRAGCIFFFSLILIQVSSWSCLCRHRFSPCGSLPIGDILFCGFSLSPDLQCRGKALFKVWKAGVICLCRLLGTLSSTDQLTVINYLAANEWGDVFCIFVIVSGGCFFTACILLK